MNGLVWQPHLSEKSVVCVLMCITMLNELKDPSSDQWIKGLRHLHGGFLCSLKAYGMSHYKTGIISPLCNKFSTDHY